MFSLEERLVGPDRMKCFLGLGRLRGSPCAGGRVDLNFESQPIWSRAKPSSLVEVLSALARHPRKYLGFVLFGVNSGVPKRCGNRHVKSVPSQDTIQ